MSGDPNYFSPLAIRIRKSNIFQTLIYSHKGIQCISNSYLRTSVNPNYFKPLSTHVSESKLFHTLNPPTHILNFMFGYLACYDLWLEWMKWKKMIMVGVKGSTSCYTGLKMPQLDNGNYISAVLPLLFGNYISLY